jgi:hypothetical protein
VCHLFGDGGVTSGKWLDPLSQLGEGVNRDPSMEVGGNDPTPYMQGNIMATSGAHAWMPADEASCWKVKKPQKAFSQKVKYGRISHLCCRDAWLVDLLTICTPVS